LAVADEAEDGFFRWRKRLNSSMNTSHNMNVLTFRSIPHPVVSEMAKHLDTNGDASWEALADRLGRDQVEIRVIIS